MAPFLEETAAGGDGIQGFKYSLIFFFSSSVLSSLD